MSNVLPEGVVVRQVNMEEIIRNPTGQAVALPGAVVIEFGPDVAEDEGPGGYVMGRHHFASLFPDLVYNPATMQYQSEPLEEPAVEQLPPDAVVPTDDGQPPADHPEQQPETPPEAPAEDQPSA